MTTTRRITPDDYRANPIDRDTVNQLARCANVPLIEIAEVRIHANYAEIDILERDSDGRPRVDDDSFITRTVRVAKVERES